MKTFISEYVSNLADSFQTIVNLFQFSFSNTWYFTSFSQDIFYTQWWRSRAISFDVAKFLMGNSADSLDLNFENVDKWFSNLALAENLVANPVYIYQAALDGNNHVVAIELFYFGYVDKRSFNQRKGVMTVKNHMALWRKQTPPNHNPDCRWIFKERADEVIGTDTLNYRCLVDHPASSYNKPITGAHWTDYWTNIGTQGVAWVDGTQYSSGSCQFPGRYLAFHSGSLKTGGYNGIVAGDTIKGHNSGATALIANVQLDSGTWSGGDATGVVNFVTQTGTFQAEDLDVYPYSGSNLNIASILGNSTAPADYSCDQSWEKCKLFGNNANFGGNRWLPWLEDPANRIYWGKYPPLNER